MLPRASRSLLMLTNRMSILFLLRSEGTSKSNSYEYMYTHCYGVIWISHLCAQLLYFLRRILLYYTVYKMHERRGSTARRMTYIHTHIRVWNFNISLDDILARSLLSCIMIWKIKRSIDINTRINTKLNTL